MSDYICLSGDCDNFALTKRGCFCLQDEQGRDWLCYEPSDLRPEAQEAVLALREMQERSFQLGLERDGTNFSVVTSVDLEVLPACLAEV